MVELRQITKRFDDVVANAGVDLNLYKGEVHALLGENGAGKTTLMNILSGLLVPDGGEIVLEGGHVSFRSPRDALRVGIGMVHQHYRLIPGFTVAENLHMGWDETPVLVRARTLQQRTMDLGDRFGFPVDPSTHIWQMSVGQQQRVEILRTLARGARILILDEPTSVLSPSEANALFGVIRSLAQQEHTVVFISHKLDEVMEIADRVTVMRAGSCVGTFATSDCDQTMLARMMVGRDVIFQLAREATSAGEPVLVAEAISTNDDRGRPALQNLSLTVRAGEIVGVAGVAGNGQRELSEVLTGLRKSTAGRVSVGGRDLTRAKPLEFIRAGVGHIPEDRRNTGLVMEQPIWRNAILRAYRRRPIRRGPLVLKHKAHAFARGLVSFGEVITRGIDRPVRHLSGGNAQRLLTARELQAATRAMVAVHPTSGLDVGATEKVWNALLEARAQGRAVLLISEDLDEVLALSDRILVLYGGQALHEFPATKADRDQIGLLMGGVLSGRQSVEGER